MMWRSLTAALAAALLVGATAHADPAPAPVRDPVKLELARQLFEISGGEKMTVASVNAMFANIDKLAAANSGSAAATMKLVLQDFRQEMVRSTPDLIAVSIPVYADVYTEAELRDYLAWLKSDNGQAILRKQPALRQQIFEAQMPLMRSLIPRMMQKAVDHACDENKCSDQDRKTIAAAVSKMIPPAG